MWLSADLLHVCTLTTIKVVKRVYKEGKGNKKYNLSASSYRVVGSLCLCLCIGGGRGGGGALLVKTEILGLQSHRAHIGLVLQGFWGRSTGHQKLAKIIPAPRTILPTISTTTQLQKDEINSLITQKIILYL